MLKVVRHCFISRLDSLSASLSICLSHLAPLCLLYTVFFLRCSPRLALRVHLRSPDTNGQSKLRHYEVPGAEVTLLWSHPPFWRCRHHPRERNSPWTFTERKGSPTSVIERTSRPREGHPELTSPNQLALAINICENNVNQMKFNNEQTDYSRARRPRIWSTGCKN